jgi:hypothetical protein
MFWRKRRKRIEPIPLEGQHADPPAVAGPPDDGGNRGSFTRPEDTLVVGESANAERNPDLQWSPQEGVQKVVQEDVVEGEQPDAR